MTLKKTKDQLIKQLTQTDNRVIALSGRWGTGKTHLWNEVKNEIGDKKIQNALYVSLFGLSSLDQIKRKLIEVAIPHVESHGGVFDGLKNLFKSGVTALSTHYKALAAINDLNVLLMAPVVLRNKVIVIDDIERKQERFHIEEVLGFIDEYSKRYDTRFILVLNDDKLSSHEGQKQLWDELREKVIDQEIRLSTSPDEAFDIAIALAPSEYAVALKSASAICGLTNIRIIIKVIRVANQVLVRRDLADSVQARAIPSIVLFSAIHFRGLIDGPDFRYALNIGNSDWLSFMGEKDKDLTDEEKKREHRWEMLMHDLGIHGCDEFEQQLVEFLESGLFSAELIEAVIDRYVKESNAMEARETANKFLDRAIWDHRLTEAELVAEAAAFPAIADLLDPYIATQLDAEITKMSGGAPIGEAIIDGWINGFMATNPTTVNDDNPFNNPLHPKIKEAFTAIKTSAQVKTTVLDACMDIIQNRGWSTLQEQAMRRATAADFEATIRNIEDIVMLRRFMHRMIEMRLDRNNYDPHFGAATERFVEACRTIANDKTSPRLSGLIKRLFEGTILEPELVIQPDINQQ